MGRRRNWNIPKKAPDRPLDSALGPLATMEAAVIYRTVTVDFGIQNILDWLVPPHVLSALRDACPYAEAHRFVAQSNYVDIRVSPEGPNANLFFNWETIGILAPARGTCIPCRDRESAGIIDAFKHIEHMVKRYNEVRYIIKWFGLHGTVGAARFYFPALGSLLPRDHGFHQCDGLRYKEPCGVSEVVPLIRRAQETVASGLLADPEHIVNGNTVFGIEINGGTDEEGSDIKSQRFMLL